MNVVLSHDSTLRLYWAGDNLGECDELCYGDHTSGAGLITQPALSLSYGG